MHWDLTSFGDLGNQYWESLVKSCKIYQEVQLKYCQNESTDKAFKRKITLAEKKKKVKKEIIPSFLQDCFLLQTQSQRAQMGFSQDMQQREYSNILLYKLFHAVNFTWRSFINWKCLKAFAVWNAVEKKYTDVKVCKTATKESKWRGHISLLAAVCVHVNTFLCLSLWGPFMDKKFIST